LLHRWKFINVWPSALTNLIPSAAGAHPAGVEGSALPQAPCDLTV
jgi:hypothetical protein